jgi:hypothetical protein
MKNSMQTVSNMVTSMSDFFKLKPAFLSSRLPGEILQEGGKTGRDNVNCYAPILPDKNVPFN